MGVPTTFLTWVTDGPMLLMMLSDRYPAQFIGSFLIVFAVVILITHFIPTLPDWQKLPIIAVSGYVALLLEWYIAAQLFSL